PMPKKPPTTPAKEKVPKNRQPGLTGPQDLVDQLTHIGFAPETAQKIYLSFVDTMHKSLVRGEEIRLRGFGVLRSVKRKRQVGTEPALDEAGSTVKPEGTTEWSYGIRFRPSQRLVGKLHGVDIPPTGAFHAYPSLDDALLAFLTEGTAKEVQPEPAAPDPDSIPQVLPVAISAVAPHVTDGTDEMVFELPPEEVAAPEPEVYVGPVIEFDVPTPVDTGASMVDFNVEKTLKMGSDPLPEDYIPKPVEDEDATLSPDIEEPMLGRRMPPTLEDLEQSEEMDFETHYNLGISYKEMTLYEQSIRELQRAIQKITPSPEDNRYFNCCSLLGMCYRERQYYSQALDWFQHAIDSCKPGDSSYLALRYELGLTYEQAGQMDAALQAFSEVYALDVSFREVTEKVKALQSELIARQERMQKVIPIKIRSIGQTGAFIEEDTWIVNISRRGAGLKTNFEHESNTVIEIDFLQAHKRNLARVVWCAASKDQDRSFRMGVQLFTDHELGADRWPPPLA
ncbi:MAG: HU family DNA-binding protein, partial [Blastocatellia bacterium]|nr:HU family DNA-binding protein [Blastocatellia bacterium]